MATVLSRHDRIPQRHPSQIALKSAMPPVRQNHTSKKMNHRAHGSLNCLAPRPQQYEFGGIVDVNYGYHMLRASTFLPLALNY